MTPHPSQRMESPDIPGRFNDLYMKTCVRILNGTHPDAQKFDLSAILLSNWAQTNGDTDLFELVCALSETLDSGPL